MYRVGARSGKAAERASVLELSSLIISSHLQSALNPSSRNTSTSISRISACDKLRKNEIAVRWNNNYPYRGNWSEIRMTYCRRNACWDPIVEVKVSRDDEISGAPCPSPPRHPLEDVRSRVFPVVVAARRLCYTASFRCKAEQIFAGTLNMPFE